MGLSIDEFLAQFTSVFATVATVAMNLFESIFGHMEGVFGNGTMTTGIVIGFVLAFFFRGIIMKLLIGAILVIVFIQLFGVPGMG